MGEQLEAAAGPQSHDPSSAGCVNLVDGMIWGDVEAGRRVDEVVSKAPNLDPLARVGINVTHRIPETTVSFDASPSRFGR